MKKRRFPSLTVQILLGLVIGIVLGWVSPAWGIAVKPMADIFLRMIRMIIAPLIFATLVMGIAGTGDFKKVGRIGLKSIIYFEIATTIPLLIGLGVVNVFKPGEAISVTAPAAQTVAAPQTGPLVQPQQSGSDFLIHVFPTSVIDSMARGDILQLVVFSSFFGLALAAIGDKGAPLVSVLNTLAETMFKFTDFVMKFAPLGVFAADRRVNRGGAEATRRAQRPLSSLIRGASPKGSRNNRFTFWRERRAGRCKAPRRRRCADIVEERQRRRCPSAAAPRRAAGSQDCRFLFCLMACSASLRAGSKM